MKYTMKIFTQKWLYRDEKTGKGMVSAVTDSSIPNETYQRSMIVGTQEWRNISVAFSKIPTPYYPISTPLLVSGEFQQNSYGYYFDVKSVCFCNPNNIHYATEYLRNYMTLAQSKKIMDSLTCQSGVYPIFSYLAKHKDKVFRPILEMQQEQMLLNHYAKYGMTYAQSARIAKEHGRDSVADFEDDPYGVGTLAKIPFSVCDAIAKDLEFSDYDTKRLMGIAYESICKIEQHGDCYASLSDFAKVVQMVSHNHLSLTELAPFFLAGHTGVEKLGQDYIVYSTKRKEEERTIYSHLIRLYKAGQAQKKIPDDIVPQVEEKLHVSYSPEQKEAIQMALMSKGVKCITGGPGTGKTATIQGIISAYEMLHPKATIKLCAPTGRAAQRMTEATGYPASTIHRLLGYTPYGETEICKNQKNPISADLIVVDEMSMVDTHIFSLFIQAVPSQCTLILSGDTAQLPPVGVGAVFHDILTTSQSLIPKVHFTEIFRQKENSPIIQNANLVQSGQTQLIQSDEFKIIPTQNTSESVHTVLNLIQSEVNPNEPFSYQILCPSRKGDSGVTKLNEKLQSLLNPDEAKPSLCYGTKVFRKDDKILMTRNNYDKGYFNGDLGTIQNIENGKITIQIDKLLIDLTRTDFDDMELAYATTIHKSQGSEFDTVIIMMPKYPSNMLVRNLFYTAMTRAKNRVIVIDEDGTMEQAIINDSHRERNTFLGYFLSQYEQQHR